MGKTTEDFFKKKKDWSIAKDDLLRSYLNAYMAKLFHTYKPTIYLDCFAGAGKFGSGCVPYQEKVDGSPLIALDAIRNAVKSTKIYNPVYLACFIEPEYYKELETNIRLSQHPNDKYKIYSGSYPGEIKAVISDIEKSGDIPNLFCYLDPFGVKYLKFETFKQIRRCKLNSIELLINFNSFGFLRYACGVWKIRIKEIEIDKAEEMNERDPLMNIENGDCLARLDDVMGTSEWRRIIEDYRRDKITGYEAESGLAALYKRQLKQVLDFKYVLSIPIRLNESSHPKYRMVYATNHEDGATIMGNVMRGRQDYLYEQYSMMKSGGCRGLFEREDLLVRSSVEENVIDFLKGKGELSGNEFFAGFYDEKFLTAKLLKVMKKLEECNRITIRRDPETKDNGKPFRFYTEAQGKHLYIRLNE
jgi:three-Cys-motif partner protein